MKVVHVDSASGWRGGQNQVLLTAKGMAARGHQVVVACQRGGVLERHARAAGLDVRPLRFRGDLWPGAAWGLWRLMRSFEADVAQLHDPHAVSAGVLAGLLGAPTKLVATRRVDFHLNSRLSRAKYHRAMPIIAVSQGIARVLEADGFDPCDVRVVYEGVPDRAPQPGGRDVLRELGLPPDALVVGNVAALTGHKDHETLLQAAATVVARVPAACFVILGEGELRASLEARARALGVQDRCVFAGFRTDLDRLIPAFDVFCLSSHMEGLGTSLLDAMAFGRAIVATRAGGIPEAVEDGVTGRVVATRDADGLASALTAVLQDAPARAAYGAAGRRRFLERFTSELMVERTLAVLQEVA